LTGRTFPGIQDLVAANLLNPLTIFGLFAVTAMLVCYALEKRSHWFVLGFALACVLGSLYGFLQGAWPFGLIEFIWALRAVRRWWTVGRTYHG
jgi:phosphatidylglycerophosphate synthase